MVDYELVQKVRSDIIRKRKKERVATHSAATTNPIILLGEIKNEINVIFEQNFETP